MHTLPMERQTQAKHSIGVVIAAHIAFWVLKPVYQLLFLWGIGKRRAFAEASPPASEVRLRWISCHYRGVPPVEDLSAKRVVLPRWLTCLMSLKPRSNAWRCGMPT